MINADPNVRQSNFPENRSKVTQAMNTELLKEPLIN